RELSALYRAYREGKQSPLPEPAIQYADYAGWQRRWLQGEVLEKQIAYWRRQLEGIGELSLPTDTPLIRESSRRGGSIGFDLGPELSDGLRRLTREEGVSLFMALLAAFQVVLGRWSGQEDIAVGTDVANRNWLETEGLIGFFVNQLVLRAQ